MGSFCNLTKIFKRLMVGVSDSLLDFHPDVSTFKKKDGHNIGRSGGHPSKVQKWMD